MSARPPVVAASLLAFTLMACAAGASPFQPGATPAAVAGADGSWMAMVPIAARSAHTAIYDPVRDRMVVFGGSDGSGNLNDVWELSLVGTPAWTMLTPEGNPPPLLSGHTAIYDPVGDRMVVFGGTSGGPVDDVWALSLSGSPAWSMLTPAGSSPPPLSGRTAIYDPVRNRILVFGGHDGGSFHEDVWALSLTETPTWNALVPDGSSPPGRAYHAAIYDPVRDRMLVFGGIGVGGFLNDVWALSMGDSPSWSALTPPESPPAGRAAHAATYDVLRDCMVVFGGSGSSGYLNDAWALWLAAGPSWSALSPGGSAPSARASHTMTYHPGRDRALVFGGYDGGPFNDVWTLSLGGPFWSEIIPANPLSGRFDHTAIYDPVRDRMLVFAGWNYSSVFGDVWALSLVGRPAWSRLTPAGSPPSGRYGHTAIYDPVRDRMVVFGGTDQEGSHLNDVWALSLGTNPSWSLLAPGGNLPPVRYKHTAVYDPGRDRMLIFGGYNASCLNDVWALSLGGSPTWSMLAPTGTPPTARMFHTAIYDPPRDRMLVFGGYDGNTVLDDTWALSLAGSPAWSAMPAGSPGPPRCEHAAIYDPVRDRMLVLGGVVGPGYANDLWALSLAGSPAWSALTPAGTRPSGRAEHSAIYDPVRDRMVVFGGWYGDWFNTFNDAWALVWGTPVAMGIAPVVGRFQLARPRPNPSRGQTTVDFDLGAPSRVVVDVFDAQGRRIRRIADGWFTAGPHQASWRGDDDGGRALGSGVYFIRMQAGDFRATRRAVRLH